MGDYYRCGSCEHADPKRKQGDKIRCKRWSRWVNPGEKACREQIPHFTLEGFDPVQQAEMMKYFQRKRG